MLSCLTVILSKDKSKHIDILCSKLHDNKMSHVNICDYCTLDIDETLKNIGFIGLTRSPYIKQPSAWDKAFYFIVNNNLITLYDYFFFIEDDVYSNEYEYIIQFITKINENFDHDFITTRIKPKSHYPTWKHWKEEYVNQLKLPSQSFNPLCRLSSKLVKKIIEYKNNYQKFYFHEILIASLCLEYNFSHMSYMENEDLKKYIGHIRYNPILEIKEIQDDLIYHPVKPSKDEREKSIVRT